MTAAPECFSGRPIDGDGVVHLQPLKKWLRLSRNIACAIAGFKNTFNLDPCPPSRALLHLFPGSHLPEKLLCDIRRHLDLLPNSYSQSGFDIMDVVLHLRLVEQAADDDQPAVQIQQISTEASVFKLTFACKSAFSLQAMYGAIEGSVLCCKKIQVFEKKGLTLGVITVAVDPGEEKYFESRITAAVRSAGKKQQGNFRLCRCLEEGSRANPEDSSIYRIHFPNPLPESSLAISVSECRAIGAGREELGRWILSADDIEFVERAGINSFIGSYKGKKVWIKKLRGCERGNGDEIEIRRDLAQLMSCGKKNLLQFCGICVNERNGLCVVTPLMEGGSVHDLIRRRKKVRIRDVVRIALDMAEGLLFVNSHGVAFRDLNSQRILLDRRGNACLGDMGIVSTCTVPWEAAEYETGGYQWLAPEIIAIDPESKTETWMSNVYSFGMVLWEMVAGEAAYSSYSPVQAAVGIAACGLRPEIPKDCPPILRSLLVRCWNHRPSKRPQLVEIVDILKQTNCFYYAG